MSVTVLNVVDGGNNGRRSEFSNDQAIRKPLLPSDWQRIRIGVLVQVNSTDTVPSDARLFLGICDSSGTGPLSSTCSHFFGVRVRKTTNWTYSSGTNSYEALSMEPARFVDGAGALADPVQSGVFPGDASGSPSFRCPIFIEIDRSSSPNWGINGGIQNSGGQNTTTDATFEAMMDAADGATAVNVWSPSGGYDAGNERTMTIDENANGALNHICIAWNKSSPTLQIAGVGVKVLA